jgi:hypothetical protein
MTSCYHHEAEKANVCARLLYIQGFRGRWRSQGKSENPVKSMGLPVFLTGNSALFHKDNFGFWQTNSATSEIRLATVSYLGRTSAARSRSPRLGKGGLYPPSHQLGAGGWSGLPPVLQHGSFPAATAPARPSSAKKQFRRGRLLSETRRLLCLGILRYAVWRPPLPSSFAMTLGHTPSSTRSAYGHNSPASERRT